MASRRSMTFDIRVDDRAVLAGLAAQRRGILDDVQKVTLTAANAEVLPVSRALAVPTRLKRTVVARSNKRGAYITTTAKKMDRRIFSVLNFGGVIATPIFPVFARALAIPGVGFRASVRTPRFVRAKKFLEHSVDVRLTAFSDRVAREMAARLESRLVYARTFG